MAVENPDRIHAALRFFVSELLPENFFLISASGIVIESVEAWDAGMYPLPPFPQAFVGFTVSFQTLEAIADQNMILASNTEAVNPADQADLPALQTLFFRDPSFVGAQDRFVVVMNDGPAPVSATIFNLNKEDFPASLIPFAAAPPP